MGTFSVEIEIGDAAGRRYRRLEALVDTGATYLVVPGDVLAALGVQPTEQYPFELADGSVVEYAVGDVLLILGGRTHSVLCVFGDANCEPLLGAVPLETFLLAPDPVHRRLVSVTGSLTKSTPHV